VSFGHLTTPVKPPAAESATCIGFTHSLQPLIISRLILLRSPSEAAMEPFALVRCPAITAKQPQLWAFPSLGQFFFVSGTKKSALHLVFSRV
jgi:hypothetical protein